VKERERAARRQLFINQQFQVLSYRTLRALGFVTLVHLGFRFASPQAYACTRFVGF
jgi:hypothetical protein